MWASLWPIQLPFSGFWGRRQSSRDRKQKGSVAQVARPGSTLDGGGAGWPLMLHICVTFVLPSH
jgi:hypothetical protein